MTASTSYGGASWGMLHYRRSRKSLQEKTTCGHGRYTSYGSCYENVDGCTYCQMIEDALETPGNQGGFLEASSTTSSNQEEQLAKL
jgi:hypothetical protein